MLLKAGASVTEKNNDDNQPIHCSAMAGCWDSVSAMIYEGADEMAKGSYN